MVVLGTAYTVLRYTSSSGIVIVSIVLYFGVKKHLFDHSAAAKCTKLACKTVLLSFFLDFTPHLITFALYTFFGFNIAVYCGPYSTFFSTMECFGCSLIYHNTMKGQNVNSKVKSTISLMIPSFSNHHKPITTAFVQSHNTPPISLHQHIAITTVHH
uniref:Uncharacterized protein n=1 Tax=Panagrolaimus sp. JU765 TaxID=591449 RepID=A0AC34QMY2_9BILA